MNPIDSVLVFRSPAAVKPGVHATLADKASVRLHGLVSTYNESYIYLALGEKVSAIGMVFTMTFFYALTMLLTQTGLSHMRWSEWWTPLFMFGLALVFGYTGVTLWAKWFAKRDSRFAGASPTASLEDRVMSLWNNPKCQRMTDLYYAMRDGDFIFSCNSLTVDDACVTAVCEDMLHSKDEAVKATFEILDEDERVRAVCLRVLLLTLQKQ